MEQVIESASPRAGDDREDERILESGVLTGSTVSFLKRGDTTGSYVDPSLQLYRVAGDET